MEIFGALSGLAKSAADKTGEVLKVGKLNAKIRIEQDNINRTKAEIGDRVWQMYQSGEELSSDLNELCVKIKASCGVIGNIRAQIEQVKASSQENPEENDCCDCQEEHLCPMCSRPVEDGYNFCPTCGAKLD